MSREMLQRGRAYVHKPCGGTTVISGNDFAGLCNPFSPTIGTVCAQCGPDSTSSFTWEDTGEKVSSYRRRMTRTSPFAAIWSWIVAPAIGAIIGWQVMIQMDAKNGDGTLGAIIGAVAMLLFIAPSLTGAFCSFYKRD